MNETGFTLFILIVVGVLSSFLTDRNVYPEEYAKASELCASSNSSLDYIEMGFIRTDVFCKNEARFTYETHVSPKRER